MHEIVNDRKPGRKPLRWSIGSATEVLTDERQAACRKQLILLITRGAGPRQISVSMHSLDERDQKLGSFYPSLKVPIPVRRAAPKCPDAPQPPLSRRR